jgi:hypothetical protein
MISIEYPEAVYVPYKRGLPPYLEPIEGVVLKYPYELESGDLLHNSIGGTWTVGDRFVELRMHKGMVIASIHNEDARKIWILSAARGTISSFEFSNEFTLIPVVEL